MANTYLIDIGLNDSTQDIARKCNANFRRLSSDQSKQSRAGMRQEAVRTDEAIAGAEARVDAALSGAVGEINAAVSEGLQAIEEKMSELMQDLIPDVGTWLYADYDPNAKYPTTTWERVSDPKSINAPLWHRTA